VPRKVKVKTVYCWGSTTSEANENRNLYSCLFQHQSHTYSLILFQELGYDVGVAVVSSVFTLRSDWAVEDHMTW
jgi:hypothetical protein